MTRCNATNSTNGKKCKINIKDGKYCFRHTGQIPYFENENEDDVKKTSFLFGGKIIVFTGKMEMTLAETTSLAKQNGAKVNAFISKKTNIVVSGAENSERLNQARRMKIPIWTEEDFIEHIARA